jgi:hypothetical protein
MNTINVAGQVFTVSTETFKAYPGGFMTVLTGKRGGRYFLRPFNGAHEGSFEVISDKTGAPLRDKAGRAIVVFCIGVVIERKEKVTA